MEWDCGIFLNEEVYIPNLFFESAIVAKAQRQEGGCRLDWGFGEELGRDTMVALCAFIGCTSVNGLLSFGSARYRQKLKQY